MSTNNNEKEYKRYANTAEELVFLTDTGQQDYPIYLLPTREIIYKRRPETEKFAVFHVEKVEKVTDAKPYNKDAMSKILSAFPSLPLEQVISACVAVVGDTDVYIYSKRVIYEIYMGDYEEPLGEFAVPYVFIRVNPHYSQYADDKRKFAITFTTLKRILSKLPENIRAHIEKRAYIDADVARKVGKLPFIKIKLPSPTPEFEKLFSDVLTKLTAVETEEVVEGEEEAEEAEEIPEEVAEKVEEVLAKPRELEVELEQPIATTAVSTTPAPSKPELVKIYLLSMRLPSKYLVQSVEYNSSKTAVQEVRKWAGEAAQKASKLETIRREAYARVSRIFCHVEEYGTWIAVSNEALEEAKKVSSFVVEELKKLGFDSITLTRYVVKAIPVYLAPEDAKDLLSAAVSHLSEDIDELKKKIGEAEKEQDKAALRRLEKEKGYREALLQAFRSYLAFLEG